MTARKQGGKRKIETRAQLPSVFSSDLEYLELEMQWIDARVARIKLERKLRQVGLRGDADLNDFFEPPSRSKVQADRRDTIARLRDARGEEQAVRERIDGRVAAHRAAGVRPLALDHLCATLGLDAFERTVLLLTAAPCFSSDLSGRLDDLASRCHGCTVETLFNFVELSFADRVRTRRRFTASAPLVANDLISLDIDKRYSDAEDLLNASVTMPRRTFDILLGDDALGDALEEFSSLEPPRATFEQVVLPDADLQRIMSVVGRHEAYLEARRAWGFDEVIRYGRGLIMLFHGKPGTGKTMTGHAVAHQLGKRILNVDIPTFLKHREAERFLPGLFREARIQNAVLFFDECELLFADRHYGNDIMTMMLTELERFEGVAILATNLPEMLDEALDRRILVKVHFKEPDREARRDIWRKHLPEQAPLADDVDLDVLADRYDMAGGYIKNAVLGAVARAVHGASEPRLEMAHFEQAARDQLRRPLGEDHRLTESRVRLANVVLPTAVERQVAELVDSARDRRTVLERWRIGAHLTYGKGLAALFSGGPGTGKSLCAEAVAGELNRPLLNVAVPAVVSKWVGETERNLVAVFRAASAHGAVCFLDEADALLSERAPGDSRHDVSAVNVLLKQLEGFDGVALLATNRPEALDAALARRLSYRIDFPFPAAAQRAAIWRSLLPPTVPVDGELDLEALGRGYALNGGEIKNAVFKAAFRAAREGGMTQALLAEAAAEELTTCGRAERNIGFRAA